MSTVVAYSPQYVDPSDEIAVNVFDLWSQAAINVQGATANTLAVGTPITEPNAPPVYETMFRFANRAANLIFQTPDALAWSFDQHANDAVSSDVPDFLLRRAPPPVAKPKGNTSAVLAEWEGYVTEIRDELIEARLTGLRGDGVASEVEEATIPKSEITEADEPLVAIGALFRLCISYEKTPAGERRRYSTLAFRRLPAYRQQDLDDAHERTRTRLNGLRVD